MVWATGHSLVEIQDEAALGLANIAKEFAAKAEIRKLGGLASLSKLLYSKDPDVKMSTLQAFNHLFEDGTFVL